MSGLLEDITGRGGIPAQGAAYQALARAQQAGHQVYGKGKDDGGVLLRRDGV